MGFIGRDGKIVIPAVYDMTSSFSDGGIAAVCTGGKWGFIDREGKTVIEPQFEDYDLSRDNSIFLAAKDGKWGLISEKGLVTPAIFDYCFSTNPRGAIGFRIYTEDVTIQGIINRNGQITLAEKVDGRTVFPDRYRYDINDFNGDDIHGLINGKCEVIVPLIYDWISNAGSNGLICVILGDKCGYIDKDGNTVIEPKFDHAGRFGAFGLAPAVIGEKSGFINEKGDFVLEAKFDFAGPFSENGLAVYTIGGKGGYLDKNGKTVIEPIFDYAGPFYDDGFAMVTYDGNGFIIDESGNFVLPEGYTAYNSNPM